jgi:hypothetical protein
MRAVSFTAGSFNTRYKWRRSDEIQRQSEVGGDEKIRCLL